MMHAAKLDPAKDLLALAEKCSGNLQTNVRTINPSFLLMIFHDVNFFFYGVCSVDLDPAGNYLKKSRARLSCSIKDRSLS